jgi:hypothetical protein
VGHCRIRILIQRRLRSLAGGPALAVLVTAGVAVAAAGCAGQETSGTAAQQVSTWVAGSAAGASIGEVDADSRAIDVALARHDPAGAIRSVCLVLANDAQVGMGNLPTPDQKLTDELNTADTTAYNAGMDCEKGASGDAALLRRSARERVTAAAQLTTALNRIAAITGHVPSTTTTTAPIGSNNDPFGN